MHLQESGEMYLETILVLSKTGKYVRSVDVSEYMGFQAQCQPCHRPAEDRRLCDHG